MKRSAVSIFAVVLALTGCVTPPKASFDSYLQSFASVRTNADELYLRSKLAAQDEADRPETEGTVSERMATLKARHEALDMGLAAVALIDRYNRVLTALAAGRSPESVQSDLSGLTQDLRGLNVQKITQVVAKAAPYMDVVVGGISLIEDALKKRKFAEAVTAAQRPMTGILEILAADADSMQGILLQDIESEQDPYRSQIGSYTSRFNSRLKEVKATPDVEGLRTRIEDARKAMKGVEHKPMKGQAPENGAAPTAADLDSMTMLVIQVEATVIEFNKVAARAAAQRAVITEYKNALTATSRAFTTLRDDMEAGRLNATADFIARAQDLKMATLRLREAR